ncbi:MAG: M48 family metallopeptidase [Tannerellaceae bacterium]|jgi:predicted metal-dependent hydrolase|nr:M48 family metallopeptidase [Tannerellaceae bacterium]
MEKNLFDKELGNITLRTSPRVKRYSLKVSNGAIIAIMPERGNEQTMLDFINKSRSKLIEALKKERPQPTRLDDTTEMQTNTFKLHIFRTDREHIYMSLSEGVLHIACPQQTNFEHEMIQQILKDMLERALRHEAKRVLPVRLHALAKQYGFSYARVRIANTKSRWGSCSTSGSINLSLSLMLLPNHLIDYVLLHELCHTVEMNHSERFWELMNKVTLNKALSLRKELKNYRML